MSKKDLIFKFRLSQNQKFELDNIAKALKMSRAALVRKMIDTTIDNYYKTIDNEEQR